jgi:hypothetical protein
VVGALSPDVLQLVGDETPESDLEPRVVTKGVLEIPDEHEHRALVVPTDRERQANRLALPVDLGQGLRTAIQEDHEGVAGVELHLVTGVLLHDDPRSEASDLLLGQASDPFGQEHLPERPGRLFCGEPLAGGQERQGHERSGHTLATKRSRGHRRLLSGSRLARRTLY